MATPFPHHYQTTLVRTFASRGRVEAEPRAPIAGGPPPELDGDSMSWSAEHLLLSSVGMCLLTTFEAFAVRDGVGLRAWEATARGTVARTVTGLALTKISVEVDMEVGNVEQARAALEMAHRHCLVMNALNVPVEIVPRIRGAELRAS